MKTDTQSVVVSEVMTSLTGWRARVDEDRRTERRRQREEHSRYVLCVFELVSMTTWYLKQPNDHTSDTRTL